MERSEILKTLDDTCADQVPHPIALLSLLSLEVHPRSRYSHLLPYTLNRMC